MARLTLPADEMNRFDVPAVCLVTGADAEVTFRRVSFRWYPRWLLLTLLPSLLLGAILIEVLTRRARGELPFSAEGWRRHRLAGVVNALAGVLLVTGLVAAAVALGLDRSDLAGALATGSILVPLGLHLGMVRGRRITCARITPEGLVTLEVPAAMAAEAVDDYRHAGTDIPIPAVPAP